MVTHMVLTLCVDGMDGKTHVLHISHSLQTPIETRALRVGFHHALLLDKQSPSQDCAARIDTNAECMKTCKMGSMLGLASLLLTFAPRSLLLSVSVLFGASDQHQ